MINAIVCVDRNFGIGKGNDLLFHLPKDMSHFKTQTADEIVVTGYNNLLSFPGSKPLKGRSTICICPPEIEREDCFCVHDFDVLVKLVKELAKTKTIWVIGGSMLYSSMIDLYHRVFVTKVDADGEAEVFFPNLDKDPNFTLKHQTAWIDDNEYKISFCLYERSTDEEDK